MRKKLCYLVIGFGAVVGEVGAAVQETGWMIERAGMTMLPRTEPGNMFASNDEIDQVMNNGSGNWQAGRSMTAEG